MMYRFCLSLLACLFLLPAFAKAEDLLMNDSVYYTMDDGIMSPEEMELEAGQIFRMCQTNHFQKNNFDCECLAGAFLIEREKRGPMIRQTDIFADITRKKPVACANSAKIAGNTYSSCVQMSKDRRALKNDVAEYCGCVANKVANDFTKTPRLVSGYIQKLTYNSLIYCENAENRMKATAAKTAN